jgi:hypothetical protein
MQVIYSHTTDIGRTLAMKHVMIVGKVDGIKRLSTGSDAGNSAPESQESTAKVV